MKHRALIIALALGAALAGCEKQAPAAAPKRVEPVVQAPAATPAPPTQVAANPPASMRHYDKKCGKSGKCEVSITVTECSANGIIVDYGVLGVETGSKDVDIRWTIATKGYEFGEDGIKFKGDAWQKEFDQKSHDKNEYKWRDRNNMGSPPERSYDYTVTIVKSGGAPCASKDPTVVNDA